MDRTAVNRSYDEYISDELKRDIFVEKDPTKNCVKYPNAEYDSYNQCDKNFNLRKLEESYVPKILPIWATQDMETVTTSHYVDWSYDSRPLYDGTTELIVRYTLILADKIKARVIVP